jgi:hypothetical protein
MEVRLDEELGSKEKEEVDEELGVWWRRMKN